MPKWCTLKSGRRAHRACVDAHNEAIQHGIDRGLVCIDPACAMHDVEEVARHAHVAAKEAATGEHSRLYWAAKRARESAFTATLVARRDGAPRTEIDALHAKYLVAADAQNAAQDALDAALAQFAA